MVRDIDDSCLVFEDIKGNLSFIESRSIICISNVDRDGLTVGGSRAVGDCDGDLVGILDFKVGNGACVEGQNSIYGIYRKAVGICTAKAKGKVLCGILVRQVGIRSSYSINDKSVFSATLTLAVTSPLS